MRKILIASFVTFGLSLSLSAGAQAQMKPQKKEQPKEAQKSAQPSTTEKVEDNIDLDSFFKKGEENARNGSSCDKPAQPANPIA